MVQLGKLKCTIDTAEGPCPEFEVPAEDPAADTDRGYPVKTIYILAKEESEYSINFSADHYVPDQNEPEHDAFRLAINVDGLPSGSSNHLTAISPTCES